MASNVSNDATLIKIAVFGICMSVMCTAMISLMFVETGDYDYDDIQAYKNDLISFSGDSMINENPWILTAIYTPWNTSLDAATHTDDDGWLYGESITSTSDPTYGAYIGKTANIKLSPDQKSSILLSYTEDVASYSYQSGYTWWGNVPILSSIGTFLGGDQYTYSTGTSNQWNYTGYRYVFDPTMPFSSDASVKDGALSLVWYTYNGQEGLSGGLDVYGGSVLLASYSATDIISDYNTTSGYATTYDFDFQGTHLTLSIKFDANVIESGSTLMQAWSAGSWSMAISSTSAGNFLDMENSNAYSTSVGNMIETFTQIYTFSLPSIDNDWMDMILWLLVGLPMTIALLCVTLRVVEAVKPI